MFSELNIQVSEIKTQKSSVGTRSLKVSFERARWEVKADGLGETRGSGIPEGRWPYSPSVMQVPYLGARTWPRDNENCVWPQR